MYSFKVVERRPSAGTKSSAAHLCTPLFKCGMFTLNLTFVHNMIEKLQERRPQKCMLLT